MANVNNSNIEFKVENVVKFNEPAHALDKNSYYPSTAISQATVEKATRSMKAELNKIFGVTSSIEEVIEETPEVKEEEYVWVEGYKGTDKNMCCRGYQYELNKKFDMPEGEEVDLCHSGFHLCPTLGQVFPYYGVGDGNRFFKVSALVPKSQTNGKTVGYPWYHTMRPDKYAAKSIIFLSECSPKEVLIAKWGEEKIKDLTEEELQVAYEFGLGEVNKRRAVAELTALGYSEEIAVIAFENDREYLAKALAKQTNISWDARILALINSTLDMD